MWKNTLKVVTKIAKCEDGIALSKSIGRNSLIKRPYPNNWVNDFYCLNLRIGEEGRHE